MAHTLEGLSELFMYVVICAVLFLNQPLFENHLFVSTQ